MSGSCDLPDEAFAGALTLLPAMFPGRLAALLEGRSAKEAFDLVASGRATSDGEIRHALGNRAREVAERWRTAAIHIDVSKHWSRVVRAGIVVIRSTAAAFPDRLRDEEVPPAVVFLRGDPASIRSPSVAIVGTRRCTTSGRDLAFELGRAAGLAGATVVSGLAIGIDGAAHRGALSVPDTAPVAVVGSGLDFVYPPRHTDLWHEVAHRGLLVSEVSAGVNPEKWRFPLRNRLLVALADVVVVVESHERGGALSTARIAMDRGRTLMAVPGSIRSSASRGTNRLLADGATPLVDVDDLLVALSLSAPGQVSSGRAPDIPENDRVVLDAVGWEPTSTDEVLRRTGLAPGPALVVLNRLRDAGMVVTAGGVWERCQ